MEPVILKFPKVHSDWRKEEKKWVTWEGGRSIQQYWKAVRVPLYLLISKAIADTILCKSWNSRICLSIVDISLTMHKSSGKENMYTELAEIPIPTSASFHSPDGLSIAYYWRFVTSR